MPAISAVIITFNEEQHIERCILSLQDIADEVLVMDSLSTDKTCEIAKRLGARVVAEPWLGYGAMKNKANSLAANDLILSIDADEALSKELASSVLSIKNNPQGAYSFNRLNNYYGKWMRHGGVYPDRKTRLFDRRKARWTGAHVHEVLELDKEVKINFLPGDLLHYTCDSVEAHVAQISRFTKLAAEGMKAKGRKPSFLRMYFGAWFRFTQMFLLKAGFLDGKAGFIMALNSAYAIILREEILWQLWQEEKRP